ncbi:hypothetical protein Tco_1071886 [Tanacetum coccineum]
MLSLKERMKLDLEARLMGETLILNRSLDPLYGDYIELNDLNEPLKLRRDRVDDLMPTIGEGEVIKEVKSRFYKSIMKDKIEFRGKNELGNWASIPIFIGNFCVLTTFIVVEDMDPYLDEGMGEVVVGKPFCEVSYVETRRFDGIITIHNKDESVIKQDTMNGISYSYQKLKGFYKGFLNLGPDFIRDSSMDVGNSRFDETKETSNETKGLKCKRRILQKMEDLKILEDLLKKIKIKKIILYV